MSAPIRYLVLHETRYEYRVPVAKSRHVAHLRPRDTGRQRVLSHTVEVEPAPTTRSVRTDYFGNAVEQWLLLVGQEVFLARARSVVELTVRPAGCEPAATPAWEQVRDRLRYRAGERYGDETEFVFASPHVPISGELAAYGARSFRRASPVLEGAIDLMGRIHSDFTFDAEATTLTTPVTRVLVERRGVCQDFAHLMIGCLRALGLPARYVSGYLLTRPPPGRPRLLGADASHAWVQVHVPELGWIDLDPTNDLLPDAQHIVLGWGRDYSDVAPLKGVIRGGGEHRLVVGVTVLPESEANAHPELARTSVR